MKIAEKVARVILGLVFTFFSIMYLVGAAPSPDPSTLPANMNTFNAGVLASGYIMITVKLIELICGLMFLTGFKSQLATVIIFPIVINIFLVHTILMPPIFMGLILLLLNLFLAYCYRSNYAAMLNAGNAWKS